MGWWTDIRDSFESGLADISPIDIRSDSAKNKKSGLIGVANKTRDLEEGLTNKVIGRTSAEEKRAMANQMNDQIRAYREQTDLSRQELERTRGEAAAQKRVIQEKQIRSLRNSYRSSGMMGTIQGNLGDSAAGSQTGMTAKLGG